MPCYRCGARQVDPDRGESPWKRGVRRSRQVLICPGCQSAFDWTADLDRCSVCGSAHLVRRLGEVECRDCGSVRDSAAAVDPAGGPADPAISGGTDAGIGVGAADDDSNTTPGLAEEVERALARVLGRTAGIG